MNTEKTLLENENPALSKCAVSGSFLGWLFPKWTKWQTLEVFYFNTSWRIVQVRQNLKTGYKQFRCDKMITYHYGHSAENLNVKGIDSALEKNYR
jgi:hypothetical protein